MKKLVINKSTPTTPVKNPKKAVKKADKPIEVIAPNKNEDALQQSNGPIEDAGTIHHNALLDQGYEPFKESVGAEEILGQGDQQIEAEVPKIIIGAGQVDDAQIESLYLKFNLGQKSVHELNEQELVVVSRYGQIAAARREQTEQQGRSAELMMVQRQINNLEVFYALANLTEKAVKETDAALKNHRDPEIPVEIVFRVAGHELVLSQSILKELSPSGNNIQSIFMQAVGQICAMSKQAFMTKVSVLNNGSGKAFGIPFNFAAAEAAIRNEYLSNKSN